MSLDMSLTTIDDQEWTFQIDGDGELDGEIHVMVLLTPEEARQLHDVVVASTSSRSRPH